MSAVGVEIVFIFLLLLLNGLFAMIEIAVVSSRKSRLRQWAQAGDQKAKAALDLVESPNRFLSTTQIGITLVGVLAGTFGGATLAKSLASTLTLMPWITHWADPLAVALVVSAITYFSLVIGELAPKRIGMGNPEIIARFCAVPMARLSRIASPAVHLLGLSTDLVLRLLRVRPAEDQAVSEEEVKMLVREGERSGALIAGESQMVEAILGLDSLCVRDLMIQRGEIVWLDAKKSWEETCLAVLRSQHSHFPVFAGRRDNLLGMISLKELFAAHHAGERFNPVLVGDHDHAVVQSIGAAVQRQQALAREDAAHDGQRRRGGGVGRAGGGGSGRGARRARTGREEDHLAPARLGREPPALLGHAHPHHPLRRTRRGAGARKRPARGAAARLHS